MSIQQFRENLIQLIPVRSLRRKLSYKYGRFPNNYVQPTAVISSIKKLELGGNVYIAGGCTLHCDGGIEIGANTQIGTGAFIMSSNHNYFNAEKVPFDNIGLLQKVEIGKNCWIGAKSIICPGVKIEEGAVVAMGAVVTKSVPKGAIVGGNPAKILKYRDLEMYNKLVDENKVFSLNNDLPIKWIRVEDFKPYLN